MEHVSEDEKIILIEDDTVVQRLVETGITTMGLPFESYADPGEGVEAIRRERPALVILDIELPGFNGFEACRRIREFAGTELPIIFLTVKADTKSRLKGFNLGAVDYIPKPFDLKELIARIKVQMKGKRMVDELRREKLVLEMHDAARREMTDLLVHDLKTPLTNLGGTLAMIRTDPAFANSEYRRLIANSGSTAELMLLMLNDILDANQSDSDGKLMAANFELFDVQETIRTLHSILEPKMLAYGITQEISVDPELRRFNSDPSLLLRILMNIFANAIKVSAKGSQVSLHARVDGKNALFEIADRGPGIPEEELGRIFEKFVRLDNGISRRRGNGIGLYFCRLAAKALGGRVWAEGRDGGGSVFFLELPITSSK